MIHDVVFDAAGPSLVANLHFQPRPKKRARAQQGRGRSYTPKETVMAEEAIAGQLGVAAGAFPKGTKVAVRLRFLCSQYRGDLDNLEKLVLDALKLAKVYDDDRQVHAVDSAWWQVQGKPNERIQLEVRTWHRTS